MTVFCLPTAGAYFLDFCTWIFQHSVISYYVSHDLERPDLVWILFATFYVHITFQQQNHCYEGILVLSFVLITSESQTLRAVYCWSNCFAHVKLRKLLQNMYRLSVFVKWCHTRSSGFPWSASGKHSTDFIQTDCSVNFVSKCSPAVSSIGTRSAMCLYGEVCGKTDQNCLLARPCHLFVSHQFQLCISAHWHSSILCFELQPISFHRLIRLCCKCKQWLFTMW